MKRVVILLTAMGIAILLTGGAGSGFGPSGMTVAKAQTSEETLSGVLNVRWVDPPPGSNVEPRVEYVLADDRGKKTRLKLDEEVAEPAGGTLALDRKRVTVEGRGTPDDQVDVQKIEPEQGARTAAEAQRTLSGSKPTVTILCRFSDSTGTTPHDKSWFETLMGGTNPGLDHYWREISYNNINLTGSSVSGWHNLTHPKSYYQVSGGYDEDLLARDCTNAANASVYFPGYTNINLMFNDDPDFYALGGSNTLSLDGQTKTYGMTWMPRFAYEPGSGVNGTGQVWLAHEMGHAFGLPHSSGPYNETYDSDWDPMSDGSICSPSHTSYGCVGVYTISYHMDGLLGWIPASRKYTATTASNQNITLERIGTPNSNSDYLMAKIPIGGSSTRFYTVEVRRLTGYDGQTPGEAVVIHKVDTTLSDRNARIVDSDNDGDPNDAGAKWLPGETFTDSVNGISIKITGATASGYDVTINPSTGGGGDPGSPKIESSVPRPEQRRVLLRANVTAAFSEEIDENTLNTPGGYSNVELYKAGSSTPVPATVSCDSPCRTVTLDPTRRLREGKWYYAVIWRDSAGVKDLEGNLLDGGGSYSVSTNGQYVYWWFKTKG